MSDYVIEKNIPFPSKRNHYPLYEMEVGDSFSLPVTERQKIAAYITAFSKKKGFKFTCRKQGELLRVWRIA